MLLSACKKTRVHVSGAGLRTQSDRYRTLLCFEVIPLLMRCPQEDPIGIQRRAVELFPDREIPAVRDTLRIERIQREKKFDPVIETRQQALRRRNVPSCF